MRAVALERYGGPEVLRPMDLPQPKVGPDVVLVRAAAAGVNPVDWKMREGRLEGRFPTHFPLIPGWDVAGTVEKVGPDVTEVAPGDAVLAYLRKDHLQWGAYAELVAVPVRAVAPKPASMSWEEAAALPLAGLTAWQALTRGLGVGAGDTLLVHAAGGGVGSLAVQLARALGARVIGTGRPSTFDHLVRLGAEPVAYGAGLVDGVRRLAPAGVDAALDLVGGDALDASLEVLRGGGRLVSIVDADGVRARGGRYVFVRPDGAQLGELARRVDAGELGVRVEATFPLEAASDAHRVLQEGHVHGKLVLTMG